jgi:ERCC4-related helicase/HKD family nuclease
MPLIDNRETTMFQSLENALETAETIDIMVGFFYFSGWKLLAKKLKDKKIRILVGKYIDPDAIPDLLRAMKQVGENVELERYGPRTISSSRTEKKKAYIESFIRIFNETRLFDNDDSQEAYQIMEDKIRDGSLEIKKTKEDEHGKFYVINNKKENSHGGDFPGTVFMGSSNFTFRGLLSQGELNEPTRDKDRYEQYKKKFDELWKDRENIDIAINENKEDFLEEVEKKLWIHQVPSPYSVYVRVLCEIFGIDNAFDIKTPSKITNKQYADLEYQIDAIRSGIDKLNKYDGAILADVVGLGKSIVASTIAKNLDLRTIIISPKHLTGQWEDYQSEFKLPGARVYKNTVLGSIYEKYKNIKEPFLIIIDEAHRFRNEDTEDYKMLHNICRCHSENKMLLLTATPFNNNPKDVFSLIKLFQTPGESTIRSVDNLGLRFRELIERHRKLNTYRIKNPNNTEHIKKEADEISIEMRRLIEPIVIRRSRLDLNNRTRYKKDLDYQGYQFSKVVGPELLTYDLGEIEELYSETLESIASIDRENSFKGTRYRPFGKIKNEKLEEFKKTYGKKFEETDFLRIAQENLASFMRRLLVMRFESSKFAFKSTLENIIKSHETIEKWWNELGKIPVMKKGKIPDPELLVDTTNDDIDQEIQEELFEKKLEKLEEKGLIAIDKKFIKEEFISEVRSDIALLKEIYNKWYGEESSDIVALDPKFDRIEEKIKELQQENNKRKIIVFTSYADTAQNLYQVLEKKGLNKVMLYTGKDSKKGKREEVNANFDAGYPEERQKNDYDVLITTDTLSEGINLHRAGIIINYDIPYNPTRVVQRIGRINRINKKVFENIYVYNFFPTAVGEENVRIKQITTLKMRLINSIIGSDTKTLTEDEELETFFKERHRKAEEETEEISWDTPFLEDRDLALKDKDLMEDVMNIYPRTRVLRKNKNKDITILFGKKGDHSIFVVNEEGKINIVASEFALPYFKAEKEEEGHQADSDYNKIFNFTRDKLFAKAPLPPVKGRRQDAIKVISAIEENLPSAKDYCHDLIKVIREYDDISEGHLKEIIKVKLTDIEVALRELKRIVPQEKIKIINERVNRLEGEYETIILSEELRK